MTFSPAAKSSGTGAIGAYAAVGVLWLGYWLADLPLSFFDDIAFVGTAVQLASGHGFTNPWVRHWLDYDPFFIYPPAYTYLLAGWFKLTGISAGALQSLFSLCGLISTVCFGYVFRRTAGLGRWIYPALVPITVMAIAYDGFRPDVPGLALLGSGLSLLVAARGILSIGLAAVLIGLSVMTAPSMAAYAATLGGWIFWSRFYRDAQPARRIGNIAILAAAACVVAASFLLMIDFRVDAFLQAFGANAQARRSFLSLEKFQSMHLAVAALAVLGNVYLAATKPVWSSDPRKHLYAVVTTGIFCSFFLHVHDIGFNFFFFSAATLFCVCAVPEKWPALSKAGAAAVPLAVTLLNLPLLAFLLQREPVAPNHYEQVKNFISRAQAEGREVAIDSIVYRYVYDMRAPENLVDFIFSRPFDPLKRTLQPGDYTGTGNARAVSAYILGLQFPAETDARDVVSHMWPHDRFLNLKRWRYPSRYWMIDTAPDNSAAGRANGP